MSGGFVPGVLRLVVTAELDESGDMLEDARARAEDGDQDFDWLVRRWEEGALLLAKFIARAYAVREDGRVVCVVVVNRGVWLEREMLPLVERQVSEIAPKDVPELSRRLGEEGVQVGRDELDEMFIHVELDERLRAALAGRNADLHADPDPG